MTDNGWVVKRVRKFDDSVEGEQCERALILRGKKTYFFAGNQSRTRKIEIYIQQTFGKRFLFRAPTPIYLPCDTITSRRRIKFCTRWYEFEFFEK